MARCTDKVETFVRRFSGAAPAQISRQPSSGSRGPASISPDSRRLSGQSVSLQLAAASFADGPAVSRVPSTKRRSTRLQMLDEFLNSQAAASAGAAISMHVVATPVPKEPSNSADAAAGSASDEALVLVKVVPPQGERASRVRVDIICVIDTSGSMGEEARILNAGSEEKHGLSLLDVAKHGVQTIMHALEKEDRISIVTFNSTATVRLPLTAMTEAGRQEAVDCLASLSPAGGTNLWAGLWAGLEELRTDEGKRGQLGHIMLLSDGATMGRESVMTNLCEYKQGCEKLDDPMPCTVNTFGFGYNIDSELLCDVARFGQGSYAFIPDCGFVGTVFVNTLGNVLVTKARGCLLELKPGPGATLLEVMGSFNTVQTEDGRTRVEMGTLQYGQTRDVVVRVGLTCKKKLDGCLAASLEYWLSYDGSGDINSISATPAGHEDAIEIDRHRCRCLFVDALAAVSRLIPNPRAGRDALLVEAQQVLAGAQRAVASSLAAEQEEIKALLNDIQGQSMEAFSRLDFALKWGCHYIPSLAFAHRLQQCNNFKDPGVQVYGGALFTDLRDEADDIFNNLPPPAPSIMRFAHNRSGSISVAPTPVSMAMYNDRYAG